MKRWSLNVWNDWRYVERAIVDVTLLRFNVDYLRNHYASVDVVIFGLGFSLTRYSTALTPGSWGGVIGTAIGGYVDKVPVESLGREHAP